MSLGYKDMTFCTYYRACNKGDDCPRALTPEVVEAARAWWKGPEPPIAMFAAPPINLCFSPREEEHEP